MPTRAIRIANCSGAISDPGRYMLEQAREGPVDAITGDYLAEFNLATNAEAMKLGNHPGYEKTGLDGFMLALDVLHEKKIKVVVNAGGLNPKGLAEKVQSLLDEKQYDDVVAWVEGDNLMDRLDDIAAAETVNYLDTSNESIGITQIHQTLQDVIKTKHVVSANAYIGARGITKALQEGAQFVICGRCTDASPVIGLSAWWHNWSWEDYDRLAGALIAGHLIECSAYVTGGIFSGAADLPFEDIMNIGYGIAEVSEDGTCIITKHKTLKGVVNENTCRCQLLYELKATYTSIQM
jgi:hypothetical protein